MALTLAFYLPQFYPTPENDAWWGKGFTEWTNVGRAKPLFKGHYQPRVPADLGYYDLRVPQTREQQAALAKEAGIDGFCYWHYWFAGRRLLDSVFEDVVNSGKPDYPFCLCWANHSWKAKTWDPSVPDKMLMEQTYPGASDYEAQFYAMLPAFKDKRYIRHKGRLLYGIFEPGDIPDMTEMSGLWNALAAENGLPGFCFFGFAQGSGALGKAMRPGIDIVVYDAMYDAVYVHLHDKTRLLQAKLNSILQRPNPIPYARYSKVATEKFRQFPDTVPCIDPDFDHSPRSGGKGVIMYGSTPRLWGELCSKTRRLAESGTQDGLMFIKAWNEWGEGNYLEPDLRYGRSYLDETAEALKK
ncbi:MAG: glycoside hydrolase family 99-like domain-containing protein [Bacteroidales bacterium]|nr:glycoside hydrolase family 99-like domain-containing protein [Bacteroidales bacterium]